MLLVQDTGSGRRLVDHVDVALGDLSYTAAAEHVIKLLRNARDRHPPQDSKADTACVEAPLQSQIVQAVTSIQRYRDQLPVKAAFTCRSVTLEARVKCPAAVPDVRKDWEESVHSSCLLHVRLTPAALDAQSQARDRDQHSDSSCDTNCSGTDRSMCAHMRPSQAGDALMKVARSAALRLEFCRLPEAAERSRSKHAGRSPGSGKPTVGSTADDLVDRQSDLSQAPSSVIVHKARNEPGLVLNCSMGQASVSALGSGVRMQTAAASSTCAIRQMSCAKPGTGIGTQPQSNPSLSLDTALNDVQLVCQCGTLAQFDKVHRIVELMNGVKSVPQVMTCSKSVEDDRSHECAVEPGQGREHPLGMGAFAGGGLPGLDWRAKLAVEQGFSVRVLNIQDSDSAVVAMSGDDSVGIPQAVFQLALLEAEASGGLECGKPGARTSAGGLQSAVPLESSKEHSRAADRSSCVPGAGKAGLHLHARRSGMVFVLMYACAVSGVPAHIHTQNALSVNACKHCRCVTYCV